MNKSIRDQYTVVIGLEVHAQLLTKSKIYNSDSANYGSAPNTNISAITLAHPGTLPKLNRVAAEYAIKMGLACHSSISRYQIFDRKNYFYPDLPKGYQLTQDRTPICVGGHVSITSKDGSKKDIVLNRIHIEEDAGKSIHVAEEDDTLLDFNRAGVALIVVVTEPVLRSSEDAGSVLAEIRKLVRYLEICDGNMEEGSLRCDANVSLMLKDAKSYGKKVEVKNMNSIRNVQRAIEHEIDRQIELLEKGEPVVSETRTFDANTGETYGMRTKEELNDYRYFPDPDLSPLQVSEEWLDTIKASMPALPQELYSKYVTEFHLSDYDAHVLTDSKDIAQYFDAVCKHTHLYKAASNWMMGPVKSYLNEHHLSTADFAISPGILAELIELTESGQVSFTNASQKIFTVLLTSTKTPLQIALEQNLIQESDKDSILPFIEEVLNEFPSKVAEYKKGKKGIMGMFLGEVKKRSKGKADLKVANELLTKKLEL